MCVSVSMTTNNGFVLGATCLQELIRRQQDIATAKMLYKGDGNEDMPAEI